MNRASQIVWLGLAVAVVIAIGALAFGRKTTSTIQNRDPSPANALADSVQREVERLTQRYEKHIDDALFVHRSGSTLAVNEAIEDTVGLVRFSTLYYQSRHLTTRVGPLRSSVPEPVMESDQSSQPSYVVDEELIFGRATEGWIFPDATTAYRWRQNGNTAQVASIDLESVRDEISRWLVAPELSGLDFSLLSADQNGAADRLIDQIGSVIWANNGSAAAGEFTPHRVMSINSKLGRWQLQSRDATLKVVEWRVPFVLSGLALAIVVGFASIYFAAAYRRALALSEQRVSFVNSVSHELRTPITNILIQGDLIADELDEAAVEPRRRLGLLREESARLSRLIDNVLTFSRSEQDKIQLRSENVDPNAIVETVLDNFRPALERHDFQIETELGEIPQLQTDPDALSQILTNLVSNVEKYARDGKWIQLTTNLDSNRLIISCADRGPGIPEKRRSRVFEAFYRATDSLREGVSGAGLGLTIARDLADRLGGELTCVSNPDGARFELTLPLPR
ncbi:MAG: HAMP domain-containing sensor histidine kinase [Verrucomicrobiota bacterium]